MKHRNNETKFNIGFTQRLNATIMGTKMWHLKALWNIVKKRQRKDKGGLIVMRNRCTYNEKIRLLHNDTKAYKTIDEY